MNYTEPTVLTSALLTLVDAGISTDVQELLTHGDAGRGVKPNALGKAIEAARASAGWRRSAEPATARLPAECSMTDDQAALLRDKYVLWERASREGPMELRDYNRRAAEALKAALMIVSEYPPPAPAETLSEDGKIHQGAKT